MAIPVTPVSWESALDLLREVLPQAPAFTLSAVLQCVHEAKLEHDLESFPAWEESSDLVILQMLNQLAGFTGGDVIVSNDYFRFASGPVAVSSSDLHRFVETHLHEYRESLFNGDTILMSPENGMILGLHHEGCLFRYRK